VDIEPEFRKHAHMFPHGRPTDTQLSAKPFTGTELAISKQFNKAIAR
jgi:hypothetical protein